MLQSLQDFVHLALALLLKHMWLVSLVSSTIAGLMVCYRWWLPRSRTYRFLLNFYGEHARASREWWAARVWWPWGKLSPLERARLRAEIDIICGPLAPKPLKHQLGESYGVAKGTWKAAVAARKAIYASKREELAHYLSTHPKRRERFTTIKLLESVPLFDIDTPAELDQEHRRDRIRQYFESLERLSDAAEDDFSTFLTFVRISNGYVAPTFLIMGLMSRFGSDWQPIINNYRATLREGSTARQGGEGPTETLEELRSFQFNCWLLWGPSIPLCTCSEWDEPGQNHTAGPPHLVMQYGYGDEANSVDFLIDSPSALTAYENWLEGTENAPIGQPRHVGAIPGAIIGRIMWGPLIPKEMLGQTQIPAIHGQAGRGDGGSDGRVVLHFERRIPVEQGDLAASNYYSAYVWVMFALVREDGTPFHQKSYRNLLPFFEHGNIADATTLQTIKENLVAKCLSAISEIIQRAGDDAVFLEYVGASDHSGCGSEIRFPPSQPRMAEASLDGGDRPPRILSLLERNRDYSPIFMNPQFGRRLRLPAGAEAETAQGGRFSSCHLPEIVDEFVADIQARRRKVSSVTGIHPQRAR